MKTSTLHTLIWSLVYGGLVAIALGLSIGQEAAVLRWTLMVGGALATTVGVILIWVRSRIAEDQ